MPTLIQICVKKTSRWVYFKVIKDGSLPITEEEVRARQIELGYHPNGFGFYQLSIKKNSAGFEATWVCSASCD